MDELVDTGADAQVIAIAIKAMAGTSHLTRFCCIRSGGLFTVLGGMPVESVKYPVGMHLFILMLLFAASPGPE